MTRDVRWIVGALAAALWIAPAVAQTGSTSQNQEKPYSTGTGADSTRSNTKPENAPGHQSSATEQHESSATERHEQGTGTSADTSAPATGTGTATSTSGTIGSGASASGSTDTAKGTATAGASAADMADTAAKLHAANQAEIKAGQYMEQHAQNKKVKDFAKKMVKDHQSLDKDLMSFAQKKHVDLSSGSTAAATEKQQAQEHMSALQGMSGAQADQHYMTTMVRDHTKDVSEVRTAEQQAKSANEKDFAKLLDKTAKKMEDHLKDAEKIQRDMTQRQARNPGR